MAKVKKIKLKSKKAMLSRFKVTGTGKLMYNQLGRRHILTKKTRKSKRQKKKDGLLSSAHLLTYKTAMCVR